MRFHLRPLGVCQYQTNHRKLESQSSFQWNPESQQTLVTCNDIYRISVDRLAEYRIARSTEHPIVVGLEKLVASCGRVGGRKDCQIVASLAKSEPEGD